MPDGNGELESNPMDRDEGGGGGGDPAGPAGLLEMKIQLPQYSTPILNIGTSPTTKRELCNDDQGADMVHLSKEGRTEHQMNGTESAADVVYICPTGSDYAHLKRHFPSFDLDEHEEEEMSARCDGFDDKIGTMSEDYDADDDDEVVVFREPLQLCSRVPMRRATPFDF